MEKSPVDSRWKTLSNILAPGKMRRTDSSIPPVAVDKMNRTAFRPAGQHSSQVLGHNSSSKETTGVDWNMKPELSSNKSWKEDSMSGPMIAAVEGGFHTQYLLFTRNDAASASAAAKSAFLLKVQSNCCWDSIRVRILEIISKQCPDNSVYPPIEKLHIDGFLVEILPKADHPEVLPPDVQKRMMSRSLPAICIRITVDHSAMNSPLCTSLATGLSAFTKLKLKFPSEKSSRSVKSSQSSVRPEGSVVPQLITSCSFGPFSNKPVNAAWSTMKSTETVVQPSIDGVPGGNQEARLHTAKPTDSLCPKPAILRQLSSSSVDSSTRSTKLNSATTHAGDSKQRLSNETECAARPDTLIISSDTELAPGTASDMRSTTNHVGAHESSTERDSSTSVLPLSSSRQNRKAAAWLPDEVIVVDEDDSLPSDSSDCQLLVKDDGASNSSTQSSTTKLPGGPSHIPHSANSDVSQTVSMNDNGMSQVLSVPGIPVLSPAAMHPVSVADVSGNGLLTVPVTSVNSLPLSSASSQPSTTAKQSVGSSPGYECTAAEVQQVTDCQQNKTAERLTNTTKQVLTAVLLTDKDSTVPVLVDAETASPVVNKALASSLSFDKESSEVAENDVVIEQKSEDTNQQKHDSECLIVASSSTEDVLTGNESELSLLPVPVESVESLTSINEQRQQPDPGDVRDGSALQPDPGDVRDGSALPANTVDVDQSDDVRTFSDEHNL